MYRLSHSLTVALILCVVLWSGSTNAKFPDDPKPCKHEDSDCIVKIINFLMNEKYEGDSSLNLIKVDPLNVVKISINQGAESPVNIDLTFSNNKIVGFKNSKTSKVKGFGKDITKKNTIHFNVPTVSLVGDYSIKGRVLVLPINGNGSSNMTMVNADIIVEFTGEPYEKDGGTYLRVRNLKLKMKPERIYYQFNNLFNGDKALGDTMNSFLNENWKEIYEEVEASLADAFGKIFESVINTSFSKYPYEKYFAE